MYYMKTIKAITLKTVIRVHYQMYPMMKEEFVLQVTCILTGLFPLLNLENVKLTNDTQLFCNIDHNATKLSVKNVFIKSFNWIVL